MTNSTFTSRLATLADLDQLHALMARAIAQLQKDFLSTEEIAASHQVMGLDTQLIRDRTYLVVQECDTIIGCGGWSYRATLYGGDSSIVGREPALLNPATDAARIRAMYTDPDHVRRGVGRQILGLCEAAAKEQGFASVQLMATLSGEPLYRACGYLPVEKVLSAPIEGTQVPLIRMSKKLQ